MQILFQNFFSKIKQWHTYSGQIMNNYISTDVIYRKYGILKMQDVVKYETIVTVFKIKSSLIKSNIQLLFTRAMFKDEDITFTYPPSEQIMWGIVFVNHLPNDILRETNFLKFKKKLKSLFYLRYWTILFSLALIWIISHILFNPNACDEVSCY